MIAEDLLKEKGISAEVINIHTIKPLDEEIILKSIEKTGCVVSAEEHNTIGGLGESVASLIVKNKLVPMEFVGVNDQFGESGKPSDLMKKYGLSKESIIESCEKVLKRKIKYLSKTNKISAPGQGKLHYSPGIPIKLNVKISQGSERDALSLLDRAIISHQNNKELDLKGAQKIFGYFDKSLLIDLFKNIFDGDEEKVLQQYRAMSVSYTHLTLPTSDLE